MLNINYMMYGVNCIINADMQTQNEEWKNIFQHLYLVALFHIYFAVFSKYSEGSTLIIRAHYILWM